MNDKQKLERLDELVLAEIMAKTDAEIIAEVGADKIAAARSDFSKAKLAVSKAELARAKAELAAARTKPRLSTVRAAGAEALNSARMRDREFDRKLTLAARNAGSDYQADMQGIEEDLAELEAVADGDGSES